jgi:hypothetical protein
MLRARARGDDLTHHALSANVSDTLSRSVELSESIR